jgi:hypothetical protein
MKRVLGLIGLVGVVAAVAMASNEITLTSYLKAEKGTRKIERSPGTIQINWTGTRWQSQIYSLTTNAWTPMAIGSVTTNGIVWLRNVGGNGSVKVSFDAGTTTHLVIKTNEFFSFRLDPSFTATNVHFIAVQPSTNVITEDFEATILED